jgi:peptide-methionine (S)-S-oxide reductase
MQTELATLGNGCFWCTEAIFSKLKGVLSVVSGYAGGNIPNPDYKSVCTGNTGHAECLQIEFDASLISFEQLLQVFFVTHDPTTLNRQGNDVGTQYRSVIFYHNERQHTIAKQVITKLEASEKFPQPIVTTLEPLTDFYKAEDYHQDYFALHGHEPYCQLVIRPKVEKFIHYFPEWLIDKS